MDATLRVAPHQQDASVGKKEGVIEQQDNNLETGFEMSTTLPAAIDEELPLSEFTELYQPEALESHPPLSETPQSQLTPENAEWFAGMEVATDKTPKSTQQTVEELSAASTRKLTASSITTPSHQTTASDSMKEIVDNVGIKSEILPMNAVLTASKLNHSDTPVASFQKQPLNHEIQSATSITALQKQLLNQETQGAASITATQKVALNAVSVHELTNIQSMTHKTNSTFPVFQRSEITTAALSDLPSTNSVAASANVADPSSSVKVLEWAKVDLTATVNNQHDKSVVASQVGEKLNAILQDKINIQAASGIKTAQIRLDPPDMGHIKLIVSIEGDKVSVNMSAQNSIVREGLIQTSDRLRNDLVNENFVNVAINIDEGTDSHSGKGANKEQGPETIARNFFVEEEGPLEPQDEFIVKI